jgi:hypothetical protein
MKTTYFRNKEEFEQFKLGKCGLKGDFVDVVKAASENQDLIKEWDRVHIPDSKFPTYFGWYWDSSNKLYWKINRVYKKLQNYNTPYQR